MPFGAPTVWVQGMGPDPPLKGGILWGLI